MSHVVVVLLTVAIVGAVAPSVVNWVLPEILRTALQVLEGGTAAAVACLLLPDYWVSAAARRRDERPPSWAYRYGFAVAGIAASVMSGLRRMVRGLADGARSAPPGFVGIVAAGTMLVGFLV